MAKKNNHTRSSPRGIRSSKNARHHAAQVRQKAHNNLSIQEKIEKAQARPGDAEKEVARLNTQLKAQATEAI